MVAYAVPDGAFGIKSEKTAILTLDRRGHRFRQRDAAVCLHIDQVQPLDVAYPHPVEAVLAGFGHHIRGQTGVVRSAQVRLGTEVHETVPVETGESTSEHADPHETLVIPEKPVHIRERKTVSYGDVLAGPVLGRRGFRPQTRARKYQAHNGNCQFVHHPHHFVHLFLSVIYLYHLFIHSRIAKDNQICDNHKENAGFALAELQAEATFCNIQTITTKHQGNETVFEIFLCLLSPDAVVRHIRICPEQHCQR